MFAVGLPPEINVMMVMMNRLSKREGSVGLLSRNQNSYSSLGDSVA